MNGHASRPGLRRVTALLVALATGLVFGLWPAVGASRADPNETIKSAGGSAVSREGVLSAGEVLHRQPRPLPGQIAPLSQAGVCEIAAVVWTDGRVRALALRMSGVDGRWLITAWELGRILGISEQTYYTWKKRYGGLGVPELREALLPPDRGPTDEASRESTPLLWRPAANSTSSLASSPG